jgi:RAB protein geranylgeranyltransferase component A
VNGTGLVEAIVATSAAKAGLKVLHLDRNDYYGQLSTSYPLDGFFQTFQSEASSSADGDAKSSSIMQHHIIDNFPKHTEIPTLVPRDYSRNRARQHYHPIITGYQTRKQSSDASPSPERSHPATWGYDYERLTPLHTALQQSRDFNIDITPKLVMATGLGVDCLIDSGVNRYLEFKSIEGIFYAPEKAKIFSVPCSKGDVFNSKLLGALEKRVLTKFLMFAADYGRIAKGMSVSEMNEYDIAMGMALYRPQNKDVKSSGYEVEGWEDRSFLDFMTHCKIPKRLQSIITHALCMYLRDPLKDDETIEEGSTSKVSLTTTRALTLLSQHMESLSR